VPQWKIGVIGTGKDGSFVIRPERPIPASFLDPAGRVSLLLQATDQSSQLQWRFTEQAVPRPAALPAWRDARAGTDNRSVAVDLDLAKGAVAQQNKLADAPSESGTVPLSQQARRSQLPQVEHTPAAVAAPDGSYCVGHAGATYSARPEHYGDAYAYSGAPATATQAYNVQHTLGIGCQATSGGTWKQNGTSTLSYGASATTANIIDKTLNDRVNYRDVTYCGSTYREATGVYDLLSSFGAIAHRYYSYCSYYTGGTYVKKDGTNYTFSSGVDLTVVNVSAQSGYDSSSELSWTFNQPGFLCGSNTGWVSAVFVESRSGE
jgi:hypothetical protein